MAKVIRGSIRRLCGKEIPLTSEQLVCVNSQSIISYLKKQCHCYGPRALIKTKCFFLWQASGVKNPELWATSTKYCMLLKYHFVISTRRILTLLKCVLHVVSARIAGVLTQLPETKLENHNKWALTYLLTVASSEMRSADCPHSLTPLGALLFSAIRREKIFSPSMSNSGEVVCVEYGRHRLSLSIHCAHNNVHLVFSEFEHRNYFEP